jgi:hypothetical protein
MQRDHCEGRLSMKVMLDATHHCMCIIAFCRAGYAQHIALLRRVVQQYRVAVHVWMYLRDEQHSSIE